MAIKQTIKYNSNSTYFAGFIQDIINQSNIKANVSQSENEILLLIDDSDEKALKEFSENINKFLPHSIFLGEINIAREEVEFEALEFKSSSYNISLCTRCLDDLTNPDADNYLDDYMKCNHYSNSADNNDFIDFTTFSQRYKDGDTLLVTDTKTLDELFIMTEHEVKALLAIEKPTIEVTIKDEVIKELTGKNRINIKLLYSARSALTSLDAKDGDVSYLFFNPENDFEVVLYQKEVSVIKDSLGITK